MLKQIKLLIAMLSIAAVSFAAETVSTPAPAPEQVPALVTKPEPTVSLTLGAESLYVFRGQFAETSAISGVVRVDNLPYNTYVSVTGITGTNKYNYDIHEFRLSAGGSYYLGKKFTALYGATVYDYSYLHNFGAPTRAYEINAGVTYDVFLHPTVVAYYNFSREQVDIEGSIHQDFALPVGKNDKWFVRPTVTVGTNDGRDLYPDFYWEDGKFHDSYYYAEGSVDLVYKPKKNLEALVGYRLDYLNNSDSITKGWYGGAVTYKF